MALAKATLGFGPVGHNHCIICPVIMGLSEQYHEVLKNFDNAPKAAVYRAAGLSRYGAAGLVARGLSTVDFRRVRSRALIRIP